jgi:hypothetical protein
MLGTAAAQALIDENLSVKAHALAMVEFNANQYFKYDYIGMYNSPTYAEVNNWVSGASNVTRYVPRVNMTQDPGSNIPVLTLVDEEDYRYPETFPLESVFMPLRPEPGIVKLAASTMAVGTNSKYFGPHVPTKSNANRFYPASKNSPFKYWRSGYTYTSGDYAWSSPFIHYTRAFWINSIVVKVQNYASVPGTYNIQYLPDGSTTWTTAWSSASNGAFPSDGTLQIYFYNNVWSTNQTLINDLNVVPLNGVPRAVKIRGLRLQVSTMSASGGVLELIELSPRLVVDLTSNLVSYNIESQISEDDSPLPVGSVSAASGSIELLDDEGLLDFDQSASLLYGYEGRNANTQISARFYGTSLAGGQEDVRIAFARVQEWDEDELQNIKLKTLDDMAIFQSTKCPRALWQGKSVTQIVRALADWAGFSNIQFFSTASGRAEDPIVPMFAPEKNATIYDTIRDIAEAYQMAMYIDSNNILRIYSKERLMNENNPTTKAFDLRYETAGLGKANIKEVVSITDGRPINDVTIDYEQKYINYGVNSVYEANKSANLNSQYTPLIEEIGSVDSKIPSAALLWNFAGANVATWSITNNVATVNTHEPHFLAANTYIMIDNAPSYYVNGVEYSLNGYFQVATAPDADTVTFPVSARPDFTGAAISATTTPSRKMHIGASAIFVDQDAGIGLPGNGYLVINGEVVYYDAKQYQYKVDGDSTYSFHWISDDEAAIAAKNSIANGSRFSFTGALRIAGRGKFNSTCASHLVDKSVDTNWITHKLSMAKWDVTPPSAYTSYSSGSVTPLRYWDSGSTGSRRTANQSMIRIAGISPDEALRLYPQTQNTGRLNTYLCHAATRSDGQVLQRVATSVRILGRNVKTAADTFGPKGLEGIAGVFLDLAYNPTIGVNGWFFEIELSGEVGPPERGGGQNVRIVQQWGSQRLIRATTQYNIQPDILWNNPAIGDAQFATMYDLELIRVPTNPESGNEADILYGYINGELVLTYTQPQGTPWAQGSSPHCGVFVRGNTYADFDYFFAAGRRGDTYQNEESRANAEGSVSLAGAKEGGLIPASWMNNMWPRMFQSAAVYPSQPYIYDEFGVVAHGVKVIKQEHGQPVFNPKVIDGRLGNKVAYFVAAQSNSPHDTEAIIVNASRRYVGNDDAVKIVGTKVLTEKRSYTLQDYIEEYGQSKAVQTSVQTLAKYSLSKYGPLPMKISSSYLQSRAAAKSLLAWIIKYSALECDKVELEIFGNPLIEPGDVCSISLVPMKENGYDGTQRFLVTEAKHSYDKGFETTLTLRRVR